MSTPDPATIDRRVFLGGLGMSVLAAPLAAEAQQARRIWWIGLLDYGSPDPARLAWWRAFQDRLRELGYVEGQNVVFQPRWGNGQVSRLQGLVTELVAAKVDVLVTAGNPASLAAKQGTSSVPIVSAKRLGLLKELIPQVSRVAALWDSAARGSALAVRDTEVAARSLGIALQS